MKIIEVEKDFTRNELEFLVKWYEVTRPKMDLTSDTDSNFFKMVEQLDRKLFPKEGTH